MWLIFEIFVVLFKIFFYYIEAVFRAIVRPSKKNIEGQTVLITGKTNLSYTCAKQPAPIGNDCGHQTACKVVLLVVYFQMNHENLKFLHLPLRESLVS